MILYDIMCIYIYIILYHCLLYICYIRRSTPLGSFPAMDVSQRLSQHPSSLQPSDWGFSKFCSSKAARSARSMPDGRECGIQGAGTRGDMARNHRACIPKTKPKRKDIYIYIYIYQPCIPVVSFCIVESLLTLW